MGLPTGELSGAAARDRIITLTAERAATLRQDGINPNLAMYGVAPEDEATTKYIKTKKRLANQAGVVASNRVTHSSDALTDWVRWSSESPSCHGIVVELPVDRTQADFEPAMKAIAPQKDVDGLRPDGAGLYRPSTAEAIVQFAEAHGIDLSQTRTAVVGLGKLAGEPLMEMLTEWGADAMGIDLSTPEAEKRGILDQSELIVLATGSGDPFDVRDLSSTLPRVFIDVGTPEAGRPGDLGPENRQAILDRGWGISAPIGGVGPITGALLLENVVDSAKLSATY